MRFLSKLWFFIRFSYVFCQNIGFSLGFHVLFVKTMVFHEVCICFLSKNVSFMSIRFSVELEKSEGELTMPFCYWCFPGFSLEIEKIEEELPRQFSYWFFIRFSLEHEKSEEELPRQFSYWFFIKSPLEIEKSEELHRPFCYWCLVRLSLEREKSEEEAPQTMFLLIIY